MFVVGSRGNCRSGEFVCVDRPQESHSGCSMKIESLSTQNT